MSDSNDLPVDVPPAPASSPGATVRAARAAAGMSIDDVAQQLKLAPRQVIALEDDDYAQLPGRTFIRGFLRNYARLLHLDADALLGSLPDASTAASLDRPALAPTTRVMGELPADVTTKPGSARWAIPLALVAMVAIAAAYQFWRPLSDRVRSGIATAEQSLPAPAVTPAPTAPVAVSPAPAAPEPAPAAAPTTVAAAPVDSSTAAPAAADDTPIVFVFRGTSWIEVKDARGNVLLSTMGYPGATHAVGGILPFDVILGNAEAVQVSLRGAAFDTTPYVKQNVAKFQVK